jgi:hypothetical protein
VKEKLPLIVSTFVFYTSVDALPPRLREMLKKQDELLVNIKAHLSELEDLLKWVNADCFYEDYVYRFYHQSFKVYQLQGLTRKIADALRRVAPEGTGFCAYFEELLQAGAGEKNFDMDHNQEWTKRQTLCRQDGRHCFACMIFVRWSTSN